MGRPKIALMMLILGSVTAWAASAKAGSVTPLPERLAQTPAAPPPAAPQPAVPSTPQSADNSIGGVATLQGAASVTRNNATSALKLRDGILKGDVLQTSATGTLGITFDDETTFTLTPNSRIAVDDFVYQEGGTHNAAVFNVLRGTVAFVASEVAKTGNMKIDTPTATLGIRGTSGVVDVPEGAAAGTAQIGIKLYPDAGGRVGRIEVFGRDGAQLGILNRGATGFAIRPGLPGAPQRFSAVPLQISAQEAARDRSFVRQAVSSQRVGRQINIERRNLRQNNPQRPNQPRPNLRQPGQQPAPGRERRPELQPQPGQPVPGRQAGGGPQRGGSGGPPRAPAPPKKPPPKGKNQSR